MPRMNSVYWKYRRLLALTKKEFFQIVRDPSSILIAFVLPLILIFIYGFGISLDANHLKIALVLEDTSPLATSFGASFTESRFFDVTIVRNVEEVKELLVDGKVRGIIVVPAYFSKQLNDITGPSPIQVIADGSEPNTANFVQNYAEATYQRWLDLNRIERKILQKPLVRVDMRFWFNEELKSRNFLVPGSLAIIMTLIGTLLTALVIAREWERGTMEALFTTPISLFELILGKLIPYYILGMLSLIFCLIIDYLIFDVPVRGSFWLLFLTSGSFLFAALSLGLMISTVAKNQFVAAQIALMSAFLPAFILSGFIFEITSMPKIIQWITFIVPARYYVSSLQTLFLAGNIYQIIIPSILAMLSFGCVVFLIMRIKMVKRLD